MQLARHRLRGFALVGSVCLILAAASAPSTPYAVAQVTGAATSGNIIVAAVNAPVVLDGDVAGRPTEFTLVLDRALDPQVEGRSLV